MSDSMPKLKIFFGTPERPVSTGELMTFWKSLTDEEKKEYLAFAETL
jgi:hypothetical protein